MKKLNLLIAILFCGIISIQAQSFRNKKISGNGHITTEIRNTSSYDIIKVSGNLDVELISGQEGSIEVEAEENLLEYITTTVTGNVLKIKTKKGYHLKPSMKKSIVITVPFKSLNHVSIAGSGDINCTDPIKSTKFNAEISGSGDINLHVIAEFIHGAIAGSGDLTLYGSTNSLDAEIAGSGDISAYELKAINAKVAVAGSGDIQLTVTNSLKASVAGSGDIHYKGNPSNVDKSVAGSGEISKQ